MAWCGMTVVDGGDLNVRCFAKNMMPGAFQDEVITIGLVMACRFGSSEDRFGVESCIGLRVASRRL